MNRKMSYFLIGFIMIGCTATKTPVASTPRIPAKFDFSPPTRAEAGATNLTIALIKPVFINEHPEYYVTPFPEMSESMANDFEELLTSKGFKIRGPFRSRDEMVYNDKLNSDFAFSVEIDLQPNFDNRKYKYNSGVGVIVPASYKMSGEITLGGSLVIVASSARNAEKIWKKAIALDRQTFTYTGSMKWSSIPTFADELKQDNEVYNLMARQLETFYNKAMNLAWQQIEPAEMKTVAEQAKKADAK